MSRSKSVAPAEHITFKGERSITFKGIPIPMDTPATPDTELPMSFESPESSSVRQASYDPQTETLRVEFRNKAAVEGYRIYECQPFPMTQWVEFMQAASKGQHFNSVIRPLYPLRRVE